MLNENAKKWVKALRSGDYDQGIEFLCSDDTFCCLGVACEVYCREHDLPKQERMVDSDRNIIVYDGHDGELPHKVKQWLGLSSQNGSYGNPQNKKEEYLRSLVRMNDVQLFTFREIADFIESEPEGLFAKEGEENAE